jgi:hypothetical protein
MKSHLEGYKKIDSLDFADNKKQLALSYLIRLIGIFVFSFLFIAYTRLVHPNMNDALTTFINIEIPNTSIFVSYLLVAISVVVVLTMHELVHASVFFIDQRVPPQLGWRGLTIFAAAPGYLNKRSIMVVNALAPFVVISLLGMILIALLPVGTLAWIFIPVVVNAAAAGGEFLGVYWLLKQPEEAVFEDNGDMITAYIKATK